MVIYKYMRAVDTPEKRLSSKLQSVIENSIWIFSHPATFNDPFEGTIPIKCSPDSREEYLKQYSIIAQKRCGKDSSRMNRVNEMIDFGLPLEQGIVWCAAKNNDNQLLWAHYADNHKGICLGYEIPDDAPTLIRDISTIPSVSEPNVNCMCGWVKYKRKRPYMLVKENIIKNNYKIKDAYFIKPRYWKYEKEWRMVVYYDFGCNRAFSPSISRDGYFATIPKSYLKEVIFGSRLDDAYIEEIKNLIDKAGYRDVTYKKEKIVAEKFAVVIQ